MTDFAIRTRQLRFMRMKSSFEKESKIVRRFCDGTRRFCHETAKIRSERSLVVVRKQLQLSGDGAVCVCT